MTKIKTLHPSLFGLLTAIVLLSGCGTRTEEGAAPAVRTIAVRMDAEKLAASGYTQAVSGYDAENTAAYANTDGTQTVRVYSAPLENDAIALEEQEGDSFVSNSQHVQTTFPASLSADTPLSACYGGQTFRLLPISGTGYTGALSQHTDAFGQERQAVVYADLFGPDIDYVCTPTSFGVNTEILLAEKPETSAFHIRLTLPGLIPDTGSPDYILFRTDNGNGQVKAILYTPLAADGNGKWSYGNTVRLIAKDSDTGTYTVEYAVDEAFLDSAKYPVTLNQSVCLYKSKQPDTSAYENTGDEAGHYLSPYMLLGDSTPKGGGWTYVRYETLDRLDIDPDAVVSAKYVFRSLFDLPEEAVTGAYAVTSDWCSINTRWFNRPPNDEKPVGVTRVKTAGDYEIDVTPLLVEMLRNKGNKNAKYSVNNSFMIRCDTSESSLLLAAGDNGLFSPFLEIKLAADEISGAGSREAMRE